VVIAERLNIRGAGLGNEIIPWAKGFIASQALNARLVGPSWGLNRRRYWRNFGTSRLDFAGEALLRLLPLKAFTAADYYNTGIIDFGEAIQSWAESNGLARKSHFVVTVGGMYGGYLAIQSARSFLWSRLLNSRRTLSNMYKVQSHLDRAKLQVAIHMRLAGEFAAAEEGRDIRTKFNTMVPGGWYRAICHALRREFAGQVQFCFFTDRETPEYLKLLSEFNPEQPRCRELSECSDLLLMASADLRVCSVSSYSLAACFLSGGPYLWYEPQLHLENETYSLWGHEELQRLSGSPTVVSAAYVKAAAPDSRLEFQGYPVGIEGLLPAGLIQRLHATVAVKDSRTDLAQYGCYPLEQLK
jgi:hypothetical protein